MDNNMFRKPQYKCSICGKVYDKAIDRANCELNCYKKQQEDENKVAEAKKAAEKDARKAEIKNKYKELITLVNNYCKDYGSLQLGEARYFDDDNFPTLSKPFGWWL